MAISAGNFDRNRDSGNWSVSLGCAHSDVILEEQRNDLDSNAVRVELYADGLNGGHAERVEMKHLSGGNLYTAAVSNARPATDYTPRAIPQHSGVAVPLESARIIWQR
jgi:starch phosphorylase